MVIINFPREKARFSIPTILSRSDFLESCATFALRHRLPQINRMKVKLNKHSARSGHPLRALSVQRSVTHRFSHDITLAGKKCSLEVAAPRVDRRCCVTRNVLNIVIRYVVRIFRLEVTAAASEDELYATDDQLFWWSPHNRTQTFWDESSRCGDYVWITLSRRSASPRVSADRYV